MTDDNNDDNVGDDDDDAKHQRGLILVVKDNEKAAVTKGHVQITAESSGNVRVCTSSVDEKASSQRLSSADSIDGLDGAEPKRNPVRV